MKRSKRSGSLLVWSAVAATLTAGFIAANQDSRQDESVKVTFYLSTDCPVAAATSPRIVRLAEKYSNEGVSFEALFPNELETTQGIMQYAKERDFNFPVALDVAGTQARKDGVKIVPTVIVRNASGAIVYRGPLDDEKVSTRVSKSYAADALDAVLAGRTPVQKDVEPFGCFLMAGDPLPTMEEVNYAEHVAEILNEKCATCHRPGEVAPFSIIGYENAKKWSRMIAKVTSEKTMPPWLAADGVPFAHDLRLSERQIATLKTWAEAGAPQGDESKTPTPPTFPVDWALGTPDLTLEMAEPIKMGAEGEDEYWHFVIKPNITEPVYVQAIDVKPGNRTIVHHVIAFLDESGQSDRLVAAPGARSGGYRNSGGGPGFVPSNSFGGWAPGMMPTRLPEGTGFLLKPGTNVVLQIHYHKSGKEEVDQTKMALYFAKEKVEKPVSIAWLANPVIRIPAGNPEVKFTQTIPIPVDITLYNLMPHMHMLGQKMKATLVKPDGSEELLIQVDQWNFNWQFAYSLKTPHKIAAGSKLRIEAEYDNSANNPYQPHNPPKDIRWGEETTDEMMLLVAAISVDGPLNQNRGATLAERMFQLFLTGGQN
ncbi:MAG: redoxin family protein [Fimbriimonadaceae bacterium]|nr:redoxin family protein [Fimbriimonadaceae bacterium]